MREQFRKMRAALQERDNPDAPLYSAIDLYLFACKVCAGEPLDPVLTLGRVKIIFNREQWERENRTIEAVRESLRQAMRELDREMLRRASLQGLMV